MAAGKVEVLLVVGGFDVRKSDLSTKMSISRKVITWTISPSHVTFLHIDMFVDK